MKTVRFVLLAALILAGWGCGGQGTEVVSPPNPSEQPIPQQIDTDTYTFTLDLPTGWSYEEYGPGVDADPDAFSDLNPETITVAHFRKALSRFTVFLSVLEEDGDLEAFVRERRPVGDFELKTHPEEDAAIAIFNQDEPGPRGGFVVDFYGSVERNVVWLRAEAVGDMDEQQQVLDDIFEVIVPSFALEPKI